MNVDFTDSGKCYYDRLGRYTLPIDSQILERFTLFEGQVVDLFDGISDEEVRQQLATLAPEAPGEEPAGEDVAARLEVLEGTVDFLIEVALGSAEPDADEGA